MVHIIKKPAAVPSGKTSVFPKGTVRKKWKAVSGKTPLRSMGWKAQGSGKRLPPKHHK